MLMLRQYVFYSIVVNNSQAIVLQEIVKYMFLIHLLCTAKIIATGNIPLCG